MDNIKMVIDSRYTDRYDNGYIYYQGKLFTGIEEWYYEDGKLGSTTQYFNGIPNGIARSFFRNGQIKKESIYVEGRVSGFVTEWHENGNLKVEKEIYNGIATRKKEWDIEGNLLIDHTKDEN